MGINFKRPEPEPVPSREDEQVKQSRTVGYTTETTIDINTWVDPEREVVYDQSSNETMEDEIRIWKEIAEQLRQHITYVDHPLPSDDQDSRNVRELQFERDYMEFSRIGVLKDVEDAILRDRQNTYGPPEDSFADIADYWTIYLRRRGLLAEGAALESFDISTMMVLLKVARAANAPEHRDNHVDMAGYAALTPELVARKRK